jgi:CBS domain-containing protein
MMSADPPLGTAQVLPSVAVEAARIQAPLSVGSIAAVTRSRLMTVDIGTLLAEVAALLASAQIGLVVVCDASGQVAGVVTETLIVRQLGLGRATLFTTRAGDVMDGDFTTCRPGDSLAEVLATMHRRGLVHVPVVDEHNVPLGVLNARDGLRALLVAGHYEEALLRDYVMGVGYR